MTIQEVYALGKKVLASVVAIIAVIYFWGVATNNDLSGDLLSPLLMLFFSIYMFNGFVLRQDRGIWKIIGCFLSLALFSWFICDFWWAFQTLVLHTDPEENFITVYGYSLTNIFFLFAISFSAYQDMKRMIKVQVMLDILIVAICMGVLLWLFVFDKKSENVMHLLDDPISMISLITDLILYAWTNVWALALRTSQPPAYQRVLVTGGLIFVVTDFIYYYIWFFSEYRPNSWIDGAYMLAFGLIAFSAYMKGKYEKRYSGIPANSEQCIIS